MNCTHCLLQVEEVQRALAARVKEVSDLGKAASSSGKELGEALAKARTETEEAIQVRTGF